MSTKFVINTDSWHYKIIIWFDDLYIPSTFCQYWQRLIGVLCLYAMFAIVSIGLISVLCYLLYVHTATTIVGIGVVFGVASVSALLGYIERKAPTKHMKKYGHEKSGDE